MIVKKIKKHKTPMRDADGKLHNEKGPAYVSIITWFPVYFIHGKQLTEEQFKIYLRYKKL